MSQMHLCSTVPQHIDRPIPSVGCFQHHLGVRASALKLQPQRGRIVDDPHRRELITGFRLAHDDRSLAMQIDPDELPNVILVHRGLL